MIKYFWCIRVNTSPLLVFLYNFRSLKENEVEEELAEISKERDSCRNDKVVWEKEKTRLKQEISDGISIVENNKGQLNNQQNRIVSMVYDL